MNTKQVREIRQAIVFANELQHAILATKNTELRHYYWVWYDTWATDASKLSKRAFWRRTETLQQREWFRLLNQLWNATGQEAP